MMDDEEAASRRRRSFILDISLSGEPGALVLLVLATPP